MKPDHGSVGSRSCSCTSCIYRSDSENPTARQILGGGSKIDRLYLGKYIPLRERKLLNRLVRTRAVYDDIRNQLLSGSSASLGRNDPSSPIHYDDTDNSPILRIVDLVDKGKILKHNNINLNECCSCCECSPDLQKHEAQTRRHRHDRKHYGGAYSISGTSIFSRQRDGLRPKGLRFKPKSIKSAPCTCVTKLSEILKRRSQEIRRKLHHGSSKLMLEGPSLIDYDHILKTRRKRKPLRKTYQKIKKSKSRLMHSMGEGVIKLRDSKDKLKDYIEDGTRRSIDKIKEAKKKIKDNLKSGAQKSEDEFEELDFNLFPIQKDSIAKFKELLESRRRRSLNKYEACDWGCYPDECDPKKCFRILKLKRRRKKQKEEGQDNNENRHRNLRNEFTESSGVTKRKRHKEQEKENENQLKGQGLQREIIIRNKSGKILRYEKVTHKISDVPQANPNIKIEANEIQYNKQQKKTNRSNNYETSGKADQRNENAHKSLKQNMPLDVHETFKEQPDNLTRRKVRVPPLISSSIESMISIPKDISRSLSRIYSRAKEQRLDRKSKVAHKLQKDISSSKTFSMPDVTKVDERYKSSKPARKKSLFKKQNITHTENLINSTENRPSHQAVNISSSFKRKSQEFFRTKKNRIRNTAMIRDIKSKTKVIKSNRDVNRLKRCFCTFKLITKKKRSKADKIIAKPVATQSGSTLNSNEIQTKVEEQSQTKNTTPRRKSKTKINQKSVAQRSLERNQAKEPKSNKQAVRINSTFSFNVEFKREKKENAEPTINYNNTPSRKPKQYQDTPKKYLVRNKRSHFSTSTIKSKYTLTKHSLRRCFCTLKLGQTDKRRLKTKTNQLIQVASKSVPRLESHVVTRSVSTGKERNIHHKLLPYECEPGICVPGECDPNICLKIISKRKIKNKKRHSKFSNTNYHGSKSTSSLTLRAPHKKAKLIQSSEFPSRKYEENKNILETSPSSPERQIVRIGSSFSFNIEFYKDNQIKKVPPHNPNPTKKIIVKKLRTLKTPNLENQGSQAYIKHKQKSTSMLVKRNNKSLATGPSMKRTLKLQTADNGHWDKNVQESVTVGTTTPVTNTYNYNKQMISRSTRTKPIKLKLGHKLKPYECEPFVCVPGKCNPLECLQRIQKRKYQSKELGTETDRSKLKSTSSMTQKSSFRSTASSVKSNSLKLHQSKLSKTKIKNNLALQPKSHQISHRQAVRISSNFSFDIEFQKTKSKSQPKVIDIHNTPVNKAKQKGTSFKTKLKENQNTDFVKIKKRDKSTGIRPYLKRCFCTLKLQRGAEEKLQRNEKSSKPLKTYNDHSKIYTVSRITIDRIEDIKKICNVNDTELQNYFSEIEKSYSDYAILANSKSYLKVNSLTRSSFHSTKALSQFATNTIQSNLVLPTFYSKLQYKNNCSESVLHLIKYNYKQNMSQNSLNFDFLNKNSPQNINATQLLKQNYYTMNIHVPQRSKNLHKKTHKLEPYECEPGVCVPNECNPYECQKLIMKRLMKRVSKMSGTDFTDVKSKSSSVAPSLFSSTKRLQSRQNRHKKEKPRATGIKYKYRPDYLNKHAVRLGSSFNFNIEFFKDQRAENKEFFKDQRAENGEHPNKDISPVKRPKTVSKSSKTKIKHSNSKGVGKQITKRRDRNSQSFIRTEHKGSGMNPMIDRCFCTLKLQKRGRHHKKELYSFDKGIGTPSNTHLDAVSVMTHSSQNTDRLQSLKLLPYECEPQVCIPGECDPYECLERIKRRNRQRKDFGTGISPSKKSNSSMTTKNRVTTYTQGNQINPKMKRKAKVGEKTLKSKPPRREDPPRQAVRIGSNFSFNVEFFKENSNNMSKIPLNLQRKKNRHKAKSTTSTRGTTQKFPKTNLKHVASQDLQLMQDNYSQIGNMFSHASTMTASFMKRCFCTAKFYQKRHNINFEGKEQHVNEHLNAVETKGFGIKSVKPFIRRCFCVLKLKGTKKEKPTVALTKSNAFTETENDYNLATSHKISTPRENVKKYRLEPYECEPGVCIPGQCDPYDCEKLIKARILQNDSKAVITDKPRTKSMASSFQSSKSSKVKVTQLNLKKVGAPRNRQVTTGKSSPTYKSLPPMKRTSSNRQVVRIGSQFSFNIEFYKDRSFKTDEVQDAAKAIKHRTAKTPPRRRKQSGTETDFFINRGVTGMPTLRHDQDSQIFRATQDRSTGVGHSLKRCFCTLKLQNQYVKQIKMSTTQGTGTPAFQEIPTLYSRGVMTEGRKWKLKPYECEPNICVPFECDPYECDKLIKKRLMKEANKGTTIMKNEPHLAYKLEPYECEPNTCVPGECNPYECADRIRLRNIKYKDSATLTKKFKSKSLTSGVRSTASSKPKKTQSVKRKRKNRRSKSSVSKTYQPRKIHDSSFIDTTRQSVRIGSGLSFDIEFYKNKSQNKNESYKPKKNKQRNRSNSSLTTQMSNRKMQHFKGVRDIDSQVHRHMQNTGVNPLLKRCFCTLKLQNSSDTSNLSKKIRRLTSPKFGTISRAARDRNVYLTNFAELLPYECEPRVCIPGECNPYECYKRIKKRLLLSQTTETDRPRRHSKSSSTFSTKHNTMTRAKKDPKDKSRPRSNYAKRDYIEGYPEPKGDFDDPASCRVGSSLNFNIEFYKKYGRTDLFRNSSKIHKPKLSERGVWKRKKTESKSMNSNKTRRRNNKLQTTQSKTESKSIGADPLLKRCFCTLALQKDLEDPPVLQNKCLNTCMKENFLLNKEMGVGTRKYIPILDPDECEPNVCIPGECDPYECYERIKLRRMRDYGTETQRIFQKYAASSCGDPECKDAATQFMKTKQRKEITTGKPRKSEQVSHRNFDAPKVNNVTRFGSNISFRIEFYKEQNAGNRLPERLHTTNVLDNTSLVTSKTYKQNGGKNFRNQSSYLKNSSSNNEVQVDTFQTATRGTGMGSLLKRCFCTLTLRNNRKPKAINKKNRNKEKVTVPNDNHPPKKRQEKSAMGRTKKVKQINLKQTKSQIKETSNKESKKVENTNIDVTGHTNVCRSDKCDPYECLERTKKRQLKLQSRKGATYVKPLQVSALTGSTKSPSKYLKDYERKPNVGKINKCDPYECPDRMKKCQLRRQSRRTATYVRPSKVSTSSMMSKFVPRRLKRVQSSIKRIRKISPQPQEIQTVVEEPRFIHMFDKPNIHMTRYGSNINFNIEFYKKTSQFPEIKVPFYEEAQYKKPKLGQPHLNKCIDIECKPKLKHEAVGGNTCGLSSCGAQVDHIKTQDKAAGVHNILKRCFCTLKLQKDGSHYTPDKVHKAMKVNRLAIDNTWINTNCNLEQQIKSNPLNRNITSDSKKDLSHKFRKQENRKSDRSSIVDSSEMQTIYPYIPSKYHQHISKTGILQIKKHSSRIQCPIMTVKLIDQRKIPNKTIRTHNRKNTINSLKSVLANAFKRIFMLSKYKTSLDIENNKVNDSMPLKCAPRKHLSALKTSKSERPTKFNNSTPKKSLSLKITKISDEYKNKYENCPCHSKKIIYSHNQCGDHDKKLLISSHDYDKIPGKSINKNKKVINSPFEHYKIVQMALLPRKSKKEKTALGEINETQNIAAQKIASTQSGDAPATEKDFLYVKKTKNKKDKNEIKEICNYPQTCPCCTNRAPKKRNKTRSAGVFENVAEKGMEDETLKKKGKKTFRIEETELKGILKNHGDMADLNVRGTNISKVNIDNLKSRNGQQKKIWNARKLMKSQIKEISNKDAKKVKKTNTDITGGTNVCRRDKCDPYECLERMKKREFNAKIGKQSIFNQFRANKLDVSNKENNIIDKLNVDQKDKDDKHNIFRKFKNYKQKVTSNFDKPIVKADKQTITQRNATENILDERNINKKRKIGKRKGKKVKGKKKKGKDIEDFPTKTKQLKQKNKKAYGVKLTVKSKGDPTAKREVIVHDNTLIKQPKIKTDNNLLKQPKTKTGNNLLKQPKIEKICTCGSKKCSKQFKQLIAKQKRGEGKSEKSEAPCVCGSNICTTETRMKSLRRGKICECEKVLKELGNAEEEKRKKEEQRKKQLKADMIHHNLQKKERKLKQKLRMKQERRSDKEAKKYKNSTDTALALDSLVDVLKLGFRTGADVAECTSKAVFNPKRTFRGLKLVGRDPRRAFSNMKTAINDSGLFSTLRRISLRFKAMKSIQSLNSRLELNEVTGLLYNMRDKKARDRIKKKRMQMKREKKKERAQTDFECSAFMSSLRRRPCLAVYYLWPWFYPHFLSLLNVWRQVTDVLLFVLAVAVWSPFILCMEICRAMVCCFFCTG